MRVSSLRASGRCGIGLPDVLRYLGGVLGCNSDRVCVGELAVEIGFDDAPSRSRFLGFRIVLLFVRESETEVQMVSRGFVGRAGVVA